MVVDTDEGAAEGEYLAKSDEDGVVYLSQWWAAEPRNEQCTPEGAHRHGGYEL